MASPMNTQWRHLTPETDHAPTFGIKSSKRALSCLRGLRDHNFLGFPVVDPEDTGIVVGLLDMIDICAFVMDFFDQFSDITSSDTFNQLFEQKLKDKRASDLMNYSGMNRYVPLRHTATLAQVMDVLSQPGVHRCVLLKKGRLERLVTQSEVLRYVAKNLESFGPALEKTLMESNLGGKAVKKVDGSSTAHEAFQIMVQSKVSALPVLSENGVVVNSISVRDIRHIVGKEPDAELGQPVLEFLTKINKGDQAPRSAVTCRLGDKVRDVVTKIQSSRIHRVWVTDADGRATGVVSLGDIFRYLLVAIPQKSKDALKAERKKLKAEARAKKLKEKAEKKELEQEKKKLSKLVLAALNSSSESESSTSE